MGHFNWMPIKFSNINDMLRFYYGPTMANVQKADDPYISTTSGNFNAIHGPWLWTQLNQEQGLFAALPKPAFGQVGWRAITARPEASWTGVAETGAIPDTKRFTFVEVTAKLKTLANNFDVALAQEIYATTDDAVGNLADLRLLHGTHHKEMINVDMNTNFDTLASNRMESIDRVTATSTERTNCGETANDEDIYGITRASSSWAEGTVDENANVDRTLTKPILRGLVADNVPEAGGSYPNMIFTGHDTFSTIAGLYEAQSGVGGALGSATVQFGINGLQIVGQGAGLLVSTAYNTPIVLSKDCVKDGSSRIYALDTRDEGGQGPVLAVEVGFPTQYFEAGVGTGNPWGPDLIGDEGMYVTLAEVRCKNFKRQGKARDLS